MMKKYLTAMIIFLGMTNAFTQDIRFTIGPEFLYSFRHDPAFFGVGGSAQADWWLRPTLALGLNAGYYKHTATKTLLGSSKPVTYGAIPVLLVVKYPIPVIKGIYGQDMFGYTFAQDATYTDGKKLNGGITYYFALGYNYKHFDISVKVGRPRFNKKKDVTIINEHNLGLRVAYSF